MTIPRQRSRAVDPATAVPTSTLQLVAGIDDADSPGDVIDVLSLTAFTEGDQPWSRSAGLANVKPEAPLRPTDGRVARRSCESERDVYLVVGDGWTLRSVRWGNDSAYVTVTAVTDEVAERVLGEAIADAVETPTEPGTVSVGFWSGSGGGVDRTVRSIDAPSWAEIRRNYPAAAAAGLDQVMAADPDQLNGRIMLLYGPPGTGKTSALRALIREWRPWCQVDCVLDPEALFASPSYLMRVVVGRQNDDDGWRMLLLEDCDELIRAGAKQSTGQALSRLLNLTDGLLGQGRRLLIGITTNEPLQALQPAVVRPGRCFAQIEVDRMTATEASAWLGAPSDAGTLAELVAKRERRERVTVEPAAEQVGGYL